MSTGEIIFFVILMVLSVVSCLCTFLGMREDFSERHIDGEDK